MILEVDYFDSLEGLADDIQQATSTFTNHIFDKERPLKVSLTKENFEKVKDQLLAYGSYNGIRHESEFMANTWQIADTYVAFNIRKEEDGAIPDKK